MARLGLAPERFDFNLKQPRAITLAMITHIPHLAGYHKDRLRIADLALQSMLTNSRSPTKDLYAFDTLIYDQGSCEEWRSRLYSLQRSGYINTVVFNDNNVGKCHALHKIMGMVDSEYIAYSDDDVLFYKEWLFKQMDLLKSHDKVALVTGWPVISRFHHYNKMRENMEKDGVVPYVDRIEDRWIELDAMGRGLPMANYLEAPEAQRSMFKVDITDELTAWAVGHHMQFIGKRKILQEALPKCQMRLMGRMREMDYNLVDAGYWSLATEEPTCRHMGNVMDNTIVDETLDMELVL